MDKSKVVLLFYTLRYLKFKQFYYRLYYALRKRIFKIKIGNSVVCYPQQLNWRDGLVTPTSYNSGVFTFLNLEHKFDEIDWNYSVYGKLWTYNLNYFDFLNQVGISKEKSLDLIYNYIERENDLKDGLEPYPISLRLINWIKFISKHQIQDKKINAVLAKHFSLLNNNLEYHLLGNHLLENALSLLFGAYYFRDEKKYKRAKSLLEKELNEQILKDGAHFELSPMYHQLLLIRLLDCINLVDNNRWKIDNLLKIMKEKVARMLGWLHKITYQNGQIPLVNDSVYGIAAFSEEIFDYAKVLKLKHYNSKLSDSGYRRWNEGHAEILMDIGHIGPDYIPGHAHADTFNFEFLFKGRPIIVDTGISTYEKNSRRQLERSTESHNTIRVDGKDSSEVWGGFRVARRAKIISFKEDENKITATHDGYKRIGVFHTRSFSKLSQKLIIKDVIDSNKSHLIESFLHFHPDCNISVEEDKIKVDSEITITFKNHRNLIVQEYDLPLGYNRTKKACKIRTLTEKKSKIEIAYEN